MTQITTKLFIGFSLTSEIKLHLSQNQEWKTATIVNESASESNPNSTTLIDIQHHNHSYIGRFLPSEEAPTINRLKEYECSLRQHLQPYCPDSDLNSLKFVIFPQVFVGS